MLIASADTFGRLVLFGGLGLFATLWFYHEDFEPLARWSWYPKMPRVARALNRAGERVLLAPTVLQAWTAVLVFGGLAILAGVVPESAVPVIEQITFVWSGLAAIGLVLILAAADRLGA